MNDRIGDRIAMYRYRVLAAMLAIACHAQGEPLKNWFDDPFFQVSSAVADCPVPLGPLVTETERRTQSHHRAERGTSCWLAGRCDRPNYYAYDRDIAEALRSEVSAHPKLFHGTSLWITVQGRVVFIEGCAADPSAGPALEALARQVPNVQQAIARIRGGRSQHVPYKALPRE